MASINLSRSDLNKYIRFIIFNACQLFFKKERYLSLDGFLIHLRRKYRIEYTRNDVKKVLNEIAEDGFLKRYSDKYALVDLEL